MIEWKCLSSCYSSCCSNLLEAPLNEKQNICNIFNKVTPQIPQNMIKRKYIHMAWANSVLLLPIVCTLSPTHMWNCWFPCKLCERMCEWSVLRSERAPCWNCPIVPFKHTSVLPSCPQPGPGHSADKETALDFASGGLMTRARCGGYSGSFLSRKMRP